MPDNPQTPKAAVSPAVTASTAANLASKLAVQHTGLSTGQVAVLRKVVTDANFRASFVKNPSAAIASSGATLTAGEAAVISRLSAAQISGISGVISSAAGKAADGTNTALYALAFAVVVAVLLAMPNPLDVAALGAAGAAHE